MGPLVILEDTDDFPRSVDPHRDNGACLGVRIIDRGESAILLPQKTMVAPVILEDTDDLARSIDPKGFGWFRRGAGMVDRGERAVLVNQEAMIVHALRVQIVEEGSDDFTRNVDPRGDGVIYCMRSVDRGEDQRIRPWSDTQCCQSRRDYQPQ